MKSVDFAKTDKRGTLAIQWTSMAKSHHLGQTHHSSDLRQPGSRFSLLLKHSGCKTAAEEKHVGNVAPEHSTRETLTPWLAFASLSWQWTLLTVEPRWHAALPTAYLCAGSGFQDSDVCSRAYRDIWPLGVPRRALDTPDTSCHQSQVCTSTGRWPAAKKNKRRLKKILFQRRQSLWNFHVLFSLPQGFQKVPSSEWKAASKHRIPNICVCLYSWVYYFPVCTPAHEWVKKRQTIPKQLRTIYQHNHTTQASVVRQFGHSDALQLFLQVRQKKENGRKKLLPT